VRGEGALVLGTAVDVVEHPAREAAAGDAPQVLDARRPPPPAPAPGGLDAPDSHDGPERLEQPHARSMLPPHRARPLVQPRALAELAYRSTSVGTNRRQVRPTVPGVRWDSCSTSTCGCCSELGAS